MTRPAARSVLEVRESELEEMYEIWSELSKIRSRYHSIGRFSQARDLTTHIDRTFGEIEGLSALVESLEREAEAEEKYELEKEDNEAANG